MSKRLKNVVQNLASHPIKITITDCGELVVSTTNPNIKNVEDHGFIGANFFLGVFFRLLCCDTLFDVLFPLRFKKLCNSTCLVQLFGGVVKLEGEYQNLRLG